MGGRGRGKRPRKKEQDDVPLAQGKGDIWSQGGIAIFGVLVYWLDENFKLHERLVAAIPFSSVRHTGPELEAATKRACSSMGIGEYSEAVVSEVDDDADPILVDTVAEFVHCTVSDNASNIVNGWNCFDGHECVDHTIALVVKEFLSQPRVKKVFTKLRGMSGHFSHSVIGCKLLYDCQRRSCLNESKPGWGGACQQATWYMVNRVAVQLYDYEHPTKAATAVPNLDGSVYRDHRLDVEEWLIITNLDVMEARATMNNSITKRYFTAMMECK
eukprot:gene34484-biopygen31518